MTNVNLIEEQPPIFYRYRAFDNFTLDALCSDSLYFSNPSTFNDPFDCNPQIECDSSNIELEELLSKMVKTRVSKEIKDSLKNLQIGGVKADSFSSHRAMNEAVKKIGYIEYMATDPDYEDSIENTKKFLLTQEIKKELRDHYERGICCFSTTHSNSLLWSHYADKHQGLCIGYSTNRRPKPVLSKVVYGGSRVIKTSTIYQSIIKDEAQASEELERDFLLRKSSDWCYENEWRLIGAQGLKSSPMLLTDVTFGMRCPTSVIHMVSRALAGRQSPVKFYEMRMGSNEYSLVRSELDIDGEGAAWLPITATSPEEDFDIEIESEK